MRIMILVAIVACAGCAGTQVGDVRRDFTTTTVGQGDMPNARANVNAASVDGRTDVAINFAGGAASGTHPWHVHDGTCQTGGGIVGDPQAYPPLRPGADGRATARARLNVELAPGQSYHVNVHRSPTEMRTIISCGDLR